MLEKRYKGDLWLKYEFKVKELFKNAEILIENTNITEVRLNGVKLEKIGRSEVERELYKYDGSKFIREGSNEVVVKINYYQGENVYYALFGENVTESLKNCLAYDTDIEAIYLKGDFGVEGDFEKGKLNNVVLGEKFRLTKQNKKIKSLIEDGFPFFSGDIVLKKKIFVDDVNAKLIFDERFHVTDVKVNGKEAGKLMFSSELDISKYLIKGENEIELTLTVGNRNLLGPFHTQNQEDVIVGPFTFERLGTWKNGKSSVLRESYSFVKTIV